MPLQSSGIIVVEKTSVISSQSPGQQQQQQHSQSPKTTKVLTNNSRQQILSSVISGTLGTLTQYKKHQQNKIMYGISTINNATGIGDDNRLIEGTPVKSSLRRHQRIISTSSSPSSTSSTLSSSQQHHQQQIKQHSTINQPQNFNQQITQINPQQHHVIQSGNQVIVSKEYIEHAHAVGAHVVNISANDLLNPQIIKLVSSDGNGQNVLIDTLGNVTTTNGGLNHHHPNSKLVVSNLTVLSSKQQQQLNASAGQTQQSNQQQINFVNAKQIPYLAKNQTVQKLVNVPLKSNNVLKNQQHTLPSNNIIPSTGGNHGQLIQKVTMPRNVQVVARVQTVGQNKPSQQQLNTNQLIMQQKYIHNISGSGGVVNCNNAGVIQTKINNVNMIKKQTINQMKVQQHKLTSSTSGANQQQQVKTFIHQQQPQQQYSSAINQTIQQQPIGSKQVKPQKIVKQFNNNVNTSSPTVTLLQQQHQHLTQAGTYTINNKLNNIQLHQQQPQQKILGLSASGNSAKTLNNTNAKYLMQNHVVIPSNSANVTINQNIQTANGGGHKNNNQNLSKSIVVNQQIINTLNNNTCGSNAGSVTGTSSGTIKFVNAHSSILQTQQPLPVNQQKSRQNNIQAQILQPTIGQQNPSSQFVENVANNKSSNENIYHIQTTTFLPSQQNQKLQQNSTSNTEDIVVVNGTQMTDELSARILQSMKSFGNQRQFQQQQQQKLVHKPTSPLIQQQSNDNVQNNLLVSREYPIYTSQGQHQYPTYQPTITIPNRHVSQSNVRSQSLEKKHHNETKKLTSAVVQTQIVGPSLSSSEFFRVNTNEIHKNYYSSPSTCNTTIIDNIPLPLPLPRGDNSVAAQQAEHEDDIIGEEIRPLPVSTHDIQLQALHAFLQDHTYVAPMPTRLPSEIIIVPTTATSIVLIGPENSKTIQQIPSQTQSKISSTTFNNSSSNQQPKLNLSEGVLDNTGNMHQQSGGGAYVDANIIGQIIGVVGTNRISTIQTAQSVNNCGTVQNNGTIVGPVAIEQIGKINACGYSFGQNISQHDGHQLDDDANSVISNDSRNGHGRLEMDLGEETETAPEAEAEDDSVTRCICDLAHDDGYMICCDKCSVWQHVDCMGIDRQNIPDEYLCELCQPRDVDKIRARSIQLAKRKEQAFLMNAQLNTATAGSAIPTCGVLLRTDLNGQLISSTQLPDGKVSLAVIPQIGGKKGKMKKTDLLNKKGMNSSKKERNNIKRKETKRVAKRKTKNINNNAESKQADKHAENLRQWIENYEIAVTNHYSPELRARLHAITKQQNLLQSITAQENKWLKNCQNMDSKGTTVPHAGGKILISNFDILPNSAIVELRGKYMLTTQYKTQNPSINMNSPPVTIQTIKNQKTSGPFIFFFQLPIDSSLIGGLAGLSTEICVDTRTYGNEARFVRRSCRPNAELQYSFEKGTIHLYIVSLTNIMASTEITIRHEPHDLLALEHKSFSNADISPTSTVCACGLSKECIFGVQPILPMSPPPLQQSDDNIASNTTVTPPTNLTPIVRNTKANRKNLLNGFLPEKRTKKSLNINRGRSTSSSGESSSCLLSPNINKNNFKQNLFNPSCITAALHDSGVYTSSSSPSVSIPSPTILNSAHSPPQLHLKQQANDFQKLQHSQSAIENVSANTANVKTPVLVQLTPLQTVSPPLPTPSSTEEFFPEQLSQSITKVFSSEQRENESTTSNVTEDSNITTVIQASLTEKNIPQPIIDNQQYSQIAPTILVSSQLEHQPLVEETPNSMQTTSEKQLHPPVTQNTSVVINKKPPSKSRSISSSEDISNATSTELQIEPKQRESRKLTREERKMEAIVRAFEKMEKTQQRKNELKNSKSTGTTCTGKRRNSTSPSPKRIKTLSQTENIDENISTIATLPTSNTTFQKKNILHKKKQKNSKSYSIPNTAQRKRRSRVSSTTLDSVLSSEDSTSLLSPTLPENNSGNEKSLLKKQILPTPVYQVQNNKETSLLNDLVGNITTISDATVDQNINQAAGLLLAFANPQEKNEIPLSEQQKQITDINLNETTQPLVSPACLLIEKVLGLESFKLPPKTTKTKKTLMSDWLNQSNEDEELQTENQETTSCVYDNSNLDHSSPKKYQNSRKGLETLVQAALVDFRQNTSCSSYLETQQNNVNPPPNFNFVAKRVEAFINQNQNVNINSYLSSNPVLSQEFNNLDSPLTDSVKFQIPTSVDYHQNSLQPLQLSSCSNSAAKKRWLRQAISEETDENVQSIPSVSISNTSVLTTSASNSPTSQYASTLPNGFTTPLKKRRVVVVRNEEDLQNVNSHEDLSLIKSCSDSSLSNEESKIEDTEMKVDCREQIDCEDDVDILRSPSPSEKIVAENLNLVKIEREDISKEIKVDVEKEESCKILKKYEYSNDESAEEKEDTLILNTPEMKEVKFECKTNFNLNNEENENKDEKLLQTPPYIKEENSNKCTDIVQNSDFSIKNLELSTISHKSESENFESVSDEIADIQKKLHSFHTENIMILQSRNKKSKRSLKSSDTFFPNEKQLKKEKKSEKISDKKNSKEKKTRKKRQLNFDSVDQSQNFSLTSKQSRENDPSYKSFGSGNNRNRRESSTSSSRSDELKHSSEDSMFSEENNLKKINNNQPVPVHVATQKIVPPNAQQQSLLTQHSQQQQQQPNLTSYISVTNYEMQTSASTQHLQQQQQYPNQIVQSVPIPSAKLNQPQYTTQPPPLHLPYYNTIYGKLLDNVKIAPQNVGINNVSVSNTLNATQPIVIPPTKSILLSDYLDTKVKSYNTLGGYISHSSMFGLNEPTTTTSNYQTNQQLTLQKQHGSNILVAPETSNLDTNALIASVSTALQCKAVAKSSVPTPPKILTKTASHDPRLNPILTAPEPAPTPKRKLSINEYRKRKQQSSESNTNSQEGDLNSIGGPTFNEKNYENGSDNSDRLKNDICDSSKVQFSPAPTLLEQQQETLCERLKSMKQQKSSKAIAASSTVNKNFGLNNKTTDIDSFNLSFTSTKPSFLHSSSNSLDSISSSSCSQDSSKAASEDRDIQKATSTSKLKDNEQLMNQQKTLLDAINVHDIDSSKINFNELRKISKNISEITSINSIISASTTSTAINKG